MVNRTTTKGQKAEKEQNIGTPPVLSYDEAATLVGVSAKTVSRHALMKKKVAYGPSVNGKKMVRVDWLLSEFPDKQTNKKDEKMGQMFGTEGDHLYERLLNEKEERIKDLQKHIDSLEEKLHRTEIMLGNAQLSLQAPSKKEEIQPEEEVKPLKPEEKKGFFSRLFGK